MTTIRDMGAIPGKMNQWQKKTEKGSIAGPRIVKANSFITSNNGVPEMAPKLNFLESFVAGGQFAERVTTLGELRK